MSKCAVVGGGVIGLMTARELQREGLDVTVIDKSEIGRESSWAGGGIFSPLYSWRQKKAVEKLARWSQQHYPELIDEIKAESGIDPEWIRSGFLVLDIWDKEEVRQWSRQTGLQVEILTKEQIMRDEPLLNMITESALFLTDVAQVRPPRLMQALKKSLIRNNVTLYENTEVSGFRMKNNLVSAIETTGGRINADIVIIAAGAWSGLLFKIFQKSIPVKPIRGQMILFRTAVGLLNRIILYRNHYLIPRKEGRILAGSTVEDVGFDKSTTDEGLTELKRAVYELLPELKETEIEISWAGLRPGSQEGVPYICSHSEIGNLFINAGHFRNGITLAPASARLLSNIILEQTPIVEPSFYTC